MQHFKTCFFSILMMLCYINMYAQTPACSTYTFNAFSEPFSYLTSGTSVNLQSDDITVRNIPIGFTFMFCGTNYTQLSACSNGWLSLGNSSSTVYTNTLSNANNIRPVLMAIFDDLYGANGGASKYVTTGTAPNRIFTFEWKDWRPLSYTSSKQVSFQVKLYESSNAIEYWYKREGSNPLPSASIGILWSSSDYQALSNTTSSPTVSSTSFSSSISAYPATNQVYRWDPPTPCTMISALTLGTYNATSANFSWTGNTDAISYDYAIDTNPSLNPSGTTTISNTTATSGSKIGLNGSTTYYIHVRARCSAFSVSQWDTLSFETLPPCTIPSSIIISNVDSNSADFQWTPAGNVLEYQYVVDLNQGAPTSTNANIKTTTTAFVSLPDTCIDGTVYYIHIRSKCVANDSSSWSLDSFRTPVPCRKPALSVSYLSSGNSIISWPQVPTAVKYEYYLGPLSSLPSSGTPILTNTVQTPYLVPNTNYTMSVRCLCEYYGVNSVSQWSSIDYTTPYPTNVNVAKKEVVLNVYPNPAKQWITIAKNGYSESTPVISVYDMQGKELKKYIMNNDVLTIDVSYLRAGVYVLRYTDDDTIKNIRIALE